MSQPVILWLPEPDRMWHVGSLLNPNQRSPFTFNLHVSYVTDAAGVLSEGFMQEVGHQPSSCVIPASSSRSLFLNSRRDVVRWEALAGKGCFLLFV